MKLLYRIESKAFASWDPVRVRLDGAHNFAALTEWHESKDFAIEYAKRAQAENTRMHIVPRERSLFRVADHLGNVVWPEPHPDLLPPGEPGRCKLCKSTDPRKCIAIAYKWKKEYDDACECDCHEVKQ